MHARMHVVHADAVILLSSRAHADKCQQTGGMAKLNSRDGFQSDIRVWKTRKSKIPTPLKLRSQAKQAQSL